MNAPAPENRGFKRQVVFRVSSEEWPLLEAAAREHGSIQAAVLAGLQSLAGQRDPTVGHAPTPARQPTGPQGDASEPLGNLADEVTAREAAQVLGLKTSTVSGYIRRGRLPGRYDGEPGWRGWLTTRAAVDAYRAR